MSSTTRPGAGSLSVANGVGDADWTDLQDNWRDADATWLQERAVVRISGSTPSVGTINGTNGNVASATEGRVFYSTNTKTLLVTTSATPTYKTVTMSNTLGIVDGISTSEIKANSGATGSGITINNTTGALAFGASTFSSTVTFSGAITSTAYLSSLKAGSAGSISTSASGFTINTSGSNAVNLTTSGTGLSIDNSVAVTGALTTTTSVTVGNGLTVSAGSVSLPATTIGSTLGVTGTLTAAAITATTVTASGLITANANITVGGTTPTIQSASGKDLTVTVPAAQSIRMTAASSTDTYANRIYYGSSSAQNAWIVYGSDPGVGNVPEGTIWIT